MGLVGATVMPHAVYPHSALTSRRIACSSDADRHTVLRFERGDVVVALGLAGLVNLPMLLVNVFHLALRRSGAGRPGVEIGEAPVRTVIA